MPLPVFPEIRFLPWARSANLVVRGVDAADGNTRPVGRGAVPLGSVPIRFPSTTLLEPPRWR